MKSKSVDDEVVEAIKDAHKKLVKDFREIYKLIKDKKYSLLKLQGIPVSLLKDLSIAELNMAIDWIKDYHKGEFSQFKKVYDYLTPEKWARYKSLGNTDLPEYKKLKYRINICREAWKCRSPKLKRSLKDGSDSTSES